jgi:hypothetical protein
MGAFCPTHGDPSLLEDMSHTWSRRRQKQHPAPETEAERQRRKMEREAEREAEWTRLDAEREAWEERYGSRWEHIWARYGGGAGYLPGWARTLGFEAIPTDAASVKSAFRRLALKHHPDHGGEATEFMRVKSAYDLGLASLEVRP